MTIVSLAALTILDAGPAGQIAAAVAAGFSHVGLRLMPLLASDARVCGNVAAENELEGLLAKTGTKVLEIGVFPIKPVMDWAQIEAVVALSRRIGARHLVCPVEDAQHDRRTYSLLRLCDLAAGAGLSVLVEFNPYSACTDLAAAVAAVEATRHPAAGLVIDALHLSRSGGHPAALAAVDPRLLQLVHFCDAPLPPPVGSRTLDELRAESRTARLLPGEGSLWLGELLDFLPEGTPISVEAPSARHAHLPPEDRARRALAATMAMLARRPIGAG